MTTTMNTRKIRTRIAATGKMGRGEPIGDSVVLERVGKLVRVLFIRDLKIGKEEEV